MSTATWGIDLSNHNRGANIAHAHAAGAAFVFLKATEGVTFTDPLFAGFRADAHRAGVPVGAYHFAHPMPGRDPAAEARHFLSVVGAVQVGELPPVLDLETTKLGHDATAEWAKTWLQTVQAETGVRPILYASPGFLAGLAAARAGLQRWPLWLASYTSHTPAAPHPWPAWLFWQHTSKATVPGVPGSCDRSVTSMSPAAVRALCRPGMVHPPVPHRPAAQPPAHKPAPHPHRPAPHAPSTGGVVLGARVLRRGDHGEDVRFVQRFLGITQDGDFGPATDRAVRAYQHLRGLRADGVVGRLTWRPMLAAVKAR